ncbi:MAG: ATP-grasp domain protein [Candidatus Methanogaster sp.]|uniref:ATP-grasp domain protein n=1 Tax=Candidatus Methanogaster sp. TaxID=3386292 RepID=A0AC61L422_9EURY|nr:MAG: ATP-grasp domain protein [ANME-2 cluster archaeon]
MKVMVAEYAVATGDPDILGEGCAMLATLANSFAAGRHLVRYPAREQVQGVSGDVVVCDDGCDDDGFATAIERIAHTCDAGIVIAPDEILADLTRIVEESTINLGCPSKSVRNCADKLVCSRILSDNGIAVPGVIDDVGMGAGGCCADGAGAGARYVIKPRSGCASEGISIVMDRQEQPIDVTAREGWALSGKVNLSDDFIVTELVPGEHLSASLIIGKTALALTVNKQMVEIGTETIEYNGGIVPYQTPRWGEVMDTAAKAADVLGCRGYVGVDIVAGDELYVVDVNPRPTTSILGIAKVIDHEIGDLIIRAGLGDLPESVGITGTFEFTKEMLGCIFSQDSK